MTHCLRFVPRGLAFSCVLGVAVLAAGAPQDSLPGVRNFARADASFACGGAVTPEAFAAIKKAGFVSVVNLRMAEEPGVDIEADRKAAAAAGLTFIHLPFASAAPDAAPVDAFLPVAADRKNQPMLIYCAGGVRASLFLAIKRVVQDGWTYEKALAELPALSGRLPPSLRSFAASYLAAHGKQVIAVE